MGPPVQYNGNSKSNLTTKPPISTKPALPTKPKNPEYIRYVNELRQQPVQNKFAGLSLNKPEDSTSGTSNISTNLNSNSDSGVLNQTNGYNRPLPPPKTSNTPAQEDEDGNKIIASAKGTFGHSGGI